MRELLEALFGMMSMTAETLFRDEVMGVCALTVSTADTSDHGLETAIGEDKEDGYFHVVERYTNLADATAGHIKWVEAAKTLTRITSIGSEIYHVGDKIVNITPKGMVVEKPVEVIDVASN